MMTSLRFHYCPICGEKIKLIKRRDVYLASITAHICEKHMLHSKGLYCICPCGKRTICSQDLAKHIEESGNVIEFAEHFKKHLLLFTIKQLAT